jgi:hypothetical protein
MNASISWAVAGGNSICCGYWNDSVSDRSAGGGCGNKSARKASVFCSIVSAVVPGSWPRYLPSGRVGHIHVFWDHDDINIICTDNISAI